jgi:hypothetical protein
MHDMDKVLSEEHEGEYGFLNEGEIGHEGEWEWEGEGEGEGEWEWEGEWEGEFEYELEGEQLEYELASELLAVTNEQELEQFLGKLVRKVGGGLSRFAKSGIGKSLIGGLKSVAKVGLPILGKAAGTFFGGPVGGMIGGKLGSMATKLFEIQSEGMSNEDLEFEMARRYVRLATEATRTAASNARKSAPPKAIATHAIKKAAAKHAPGLMRKTGSTSRGSYGGGGSSSYAGGGGGGYSSDDRGSAQSGTWSRQGNQIVIYGV